MSDPHSRLCQIILEEHFGPTVAKVGSNISVYGVKTLSQVCSSSDLSVKEVKNNFALLLHHSLLSFSDKRKPGVADYSIQKERILSILRYPQYISLAARVAGPEGAEIIKNLCKVGRLTASDLLVETYKSVNAGVEDPNQITSLQKLESAFQTLISRKMVERCPANSSPENDVPTLEADERLQFSPPPLDLKVLKDWIESNSELETKDKGIDWRMNLNVLNQKVRDRIIEDAAAKRVDRFAAKIVRSVLEIASDMYDPWSQVSGHLSYPVIAEKVRRDWKEEQEDVVEHLDQYLTILTSDRTRFIDKVGDSGGGQYTINFKHIFQEITAATVDKIILEKFGSKSMRIFRYIREKKYVEENQIQQVVMIPGKETKLLTYQLMENNLVFLQELRKSVAPNAPSKAIYLFYVNLDQVARSCILLCLNAIYNLKKRAALEMTENIRLLEKYERVENILESLRAEGGTPEQVEEVEEMLTPPEREAVQNLQKRLEQLSLAQILNEETLFILETYIRYQTS